VVAEAARIAQTHPADSVPTEADEAALAEVVGEQILVIDDDPSMAVVLTQAMGEKTRITHATNLAEAIAAFDNADIGIVLSDTQVANADTTVLLKVLKRDHPGIVTVVYTAAADAVDVITLINQGQIFRFIPKPVKPVTLKLALIAAMIKRKELKQNPLAVKRYGVEDVSEGAKESLLRHIESSAPATAGAEQVNTSMLQKIGVSFKRLFGGG
jgi:serine/threonine-protein kinase